MRSSPIDSNQLSFLIGLHVEQVSVGEHQVILHFSDDVDLSIETTVRQAMPKAAGEVSWSPGIVTQPIYLQRVLGATVDSQRVSEDGSLRLSFSSGDTMSIERRPDGLESYQITKPDACIVV